MVVTFKPHQDLKKYNCVLQYPTDRWSIEKFKTFKMLKVTKSANEYNILFFMCEKKPQRKNVFSVKVIFQNIKLQFSKLQKCMRQSLC